MPGGKGKPLDQWPIAELVGVGLVCASILGSGVFVIVRGSCKAWGEGDWRSLAFALALAIFLWPPALGTLLFAKEFWRRWCSRHGCAPRAARADQANLKAKSNQRGDPPDHE